MSANEVVPFEQRLGALTVADVRAQVNLIQHIMKEVMKKDEHYGVIPGTAKPTLLKAGAEKLCLTFRLDPQYETTERYDGMHLTVVSKCTLWHIPSGQRYGSGMGSCSTKESKYAYRQAGVKCPNCGKEAIIKGKDFKGDGAPTGWVCFSKKGGCGTKFKDGDEAIEKQPRGRIPNEDLADQYNTALKMANKRSLVAASLNVTAASDIFTQDIEDTEPATSQAPPTNPSLPPAGDAAKVTLEQAMDLAQTLADCDKRAEAAFLKIAKIERLDNLLAADYAEALDWVKRRKAKAELAEQA